MLDPEANFAEVSRWVLHQNIAGSAEHQQECAGINGSHDRGLVGGRQFLEKKKLFWALSEFCFYNTTDGHRENCGECLQSGLIIRPRSPLRLYGPLLALWAQKKKRTGSAASEAPQPAGFSQPAATRRSHVCLLPVCKHAMPCTVCSAGRRRSESRF